MNPWSVLAAATCVLALAACGTPAEQRSLNEPVVPTSPNAAYQTAFPETVATDVTILGAPADEQGAAEPTPDAAPLVASPVNEEITVSPVTIDLQQTTATATP